MTNHISHNEMFIVVRQCTCCCTERTDGRALVIVAVRLVQGNELPRDDQSVQCTEQ